MNKKITVREGIESVWHYHLAIDNKTLCGNEHTIFTSLPIKTWGMKSDHLSETYCKKCDKIAKEKQLI